MPAPINNRQATKRKKASTDFQENPFDLVPLIQLISDLPTSNIATIPSEL